MRIASLTLMAILLTAFWAGERWAQANTAGSTSNKWINEREQALFVLVDEPLLHFKNSASCFSKKTSANPGRVGC